MRLARNLLAGGCRCNTIVLKDLQNNRCLDRCQACPRSATIKNLRAITAMSSQVRPWNRVPQTVYSLSTVESTGDNDRLNMNICTYVSPMTMEPKQYMIGVYHNTKTFENFKKTGEALLQILGIHQTRYVNALGKKSGLTIDKDPYLRKRVSFPKSPAHLAYLNDCLAYLHLAVKTWTPASDHDLVFCEVLSWKNIQNGIPLTTTYLKEKKVIL